MDQEKFTAIRSYDEIITQTPEIASKFQTVGNGSSQLSGNSELLLSLKQEEAHTDNDQSMNNRKDDQTRQQGSWSVYNTTSKA